eukprot:s2108_g11.t1
MLSCDNEEPRWGRNIETPGEDPYLTGEYAENFDSAVSMQDLVDSYMRPFQACVEKGRVSSLMCSYNAVNEVPSCANDWLLQTVARDNWGFDGYITSDCDADADVYKSHHYTSTPEEAVKAVLNAGTDIDCTSFVPTYAQSALDKGLISVQDIDERLKMLFRVRMRLSHFDPKGPLDYIPASTICSDYAMQLSHDAVQQSASLLKNMEQTLPLQKDRVGTVAIIGPNWNLSKSDAGYYGPSHPCGRFFTLVDAVSNGGQVKTESIAGVPSVLSEDQSGIDAAVEMAKRVDTVLLAVGTDLSWAAEGHDAKNISFTTAQRVLIQRVAAAAKKPVVIVTFTAVPLDISEILANPKVGAVLHLGQPSVAVLGVAPILYGESKSCLAEAMFLLAMPPRTYRFYTGKAVVPFGFGLSYTTFRYSLATVPKSLSLEPLRDLLTSQSDLFPRSAQLQSTMSRSNWKEQAQYAVRVTNTGDRDADDTVLGFLIPPDAGKDGIPLKILFGFQRVHVKAGATETVWLYPSMLDFATVGTNGQFKLHPGEYRVQFGVPETLPSGGFAEDKLSAMLAIEPTDLPDIMAGPDAAVLPARPVAEFRSLGDGISTLPASSYGSLASVFLHLMRDWSEMCEHVISVQYTPVPPVPRKKSWSSGDAWPMGVVLDLFVKDPEPSQEAGHRHQTVLNPPIENDTCDASHELHVAHETLKLERHRTGKCKPCVFFASRHGCADSFCGFCHWAHQSPKRRPRKQMRDFFKAAVEEVFQRQELAVDPKNIAENIAEILELVPIGEPKTDKLFASPCNAWLHETSTCTRSLLDRLSCIRSVLLEPATLTSWTEADKEAFGTSQQSGGLGRLAMMLAAEGFQVEANDASRLFLTFADYILNRASWWL